MTAPPTDDEETPTPKCPICRHEQRTWRVCPGCVARVDRQLRDLLDLHALAHDPDNLMPGRGGDGRGTDRPIGINVAVLDLAHGEILLGVLESWERWWREHWGLSSYGVASSSRLAAPYSHGSAVLVSGATSRTLVGVVGFLRAWWPRAAEVTEPPPDEFADEVRRLHSAAMASLSMSRFDLDPDPEAQEPADWTIRCPNTLADGATCGHRIGMRRGLRPIDHRPPDPVAVTCPACRRHWDGPWLVRVAVDAGMDVAMSLSQVMELYGCTERTIRRKVAAGLLELDRGRYRVARHAEADSA